MVGRIALLALAWVGTASLYVDLAQSVKNCEYSYHKCLDALGYSQEAQRSEGFFSGWFSGKQRCRGCRFCRRKKQEEPVSKRLWCAARTLAKDFCERYIANSR